MPRGVYNRSKNSRTRAAAPKKDRLDLVQIARYRLDELEEIERKFNDGRFFLLDISCSNYLGSYETLDGALERAADRVDDHGDDADNLKVLKVVQAFNIRTQTSAEETSDLDW